MVDLSQFGSIAGLAALVGLIIQVVKSQIQKTLIPYVAIGIGIVLAVLIGLALGQIHAAADVASWIVGGLLSGVAAIGGYEATLNQIQIGPPSGTVGTLPAKDPTPPKVG